ncbi:hypothetical protein CASFOL_032774 [Castilleja foliolosa]|uniref:HIT-type domain-containing protein n=1 Tax=Castilleja foliolosa TaxID=1961234 RepID=A0ABD3C3B5_9LAMI
MGPKKCEVCEESQSKYKCPSCLIPYHEFLLYRILAISRSCSLACFKKHKEVPCAKPDTVKEKIIDAASGSATNDDKPCYVDEQHEVLQESQLQSVALSNEISDSLRDEKLRKLIHNIDSSADPENELDKAMKDEEFRLFTEKILSTIGSCEA